MVLKKLATSHLCNLHVKFYGIIIISHPYKPTIEPLNKQKTTRKIAQNGTIGYNGTHYYIDYKLSGKTVEIQEANLGKPYIFFSFLVVL